MDVDHILRTFHEHGVECVLIGGMNFFLVHKPVVTFDVDFWVNDLPDNHRSLHAALADLDAEVSFDIKGDEWRKVGDLGSADWLVRSAVFCLNSPYGPIDIFRFVPGLEAGFDMLRVRFIDRRTPTGIPFRSLPDDLMIACQLALPENNRKQDRLRALGYSA